MEQYELVQVGKDDNILQIVFKNLVKMYSYEWSQYIGLEVNELGEYPFEKYLPSYFESQDKKAFLLQATKENKKIWAGFALVDKDFIIHPDYDYSMAEFFVMYSHRRNKAGYYMATELFRRYPGKWEIGRNPDNKPSVYFWDKVVNEYTNHHYDVVYQCEKHRFINGVLGDVLSFDSRKNS